MKEDIALKKKNVTAIISSVTNTGATNCHDLSEIPISTLVEPVDVNVRTTDVIQAKTLRIRLQFQSQAPNGVVSTWRDGCSLVRYIIFSWAPYDSATNVSTGCPGDILDLYQGPAAGFEVLAPWVSAGLKGQFKVHLDESLSLSPSAGASELAGAVQWYEVRVLISFVRLH